MTATAGVDQQSFLPVVAVAETPSSATLPPMHRSMAGPTSPVSVMDEGNSSMAPPSAKLLPATRLEPLFHKAMDEEDNDSVKAAQRDAKNNNKNAGVSQHSISLDYLPFQDTDPEQREQQKQERRRVTKSIFLPLYVATALLLFLPILPSFLVILLGTVWGILFVATPVYFFYYYDPLADMPCVS